MNIVDERERKETKREICGSKLRIGRKKDGGKMKGKEKRKGTIKGVRDIMHRFNIVFPLKFGYKKSLITAHTETILETSIQLAIIQAFTAF